MFYNADGRLVSILASWTDADAPDVFSQAAGGRSWFRTDDLRRLRSLIDELLLEGSDDVN
ncbi:lipopolysaccharide biosynthesis protein [Paraburkholderia sp. JPY419]